MNAHLEKLAHHLTMRNMVPEQQEPTSESFKEASTSVEA